MTCGELIGFLWRYVEDELSPDERGRFEVHLAICPDCASYLESYRETIRLARDAYVEPDADVPEDVPEDLVRAILDARAD